MPGLAMVAACAALLLLPGRAFATVPDSGLPPDRPNRLPAWKDWRDEATHRFPRFMQSIFDHDTRAVRLALDSGMTVDWETETGFSPLSLAMSAGYEDLAIVFLQRGGKMQDAGLRKLAMSRPSKALIDAIVENAGGNVFGPVELGSAIASGAPKEVLDFLIKSVVELGTTVRSGFVFSVLAKSKAYDSTARIREMAHRLLDAGIRPAKEDYQSEHFHSTLALLFRKAQDSSLIRRFEFWEPRFPYHSDPGKLNLDLAWVNSLAEADSLLAMGADPAANLGRCSSGDGTDKSSALAYRIKRDCETNPRPFSALDWQLAERFLRHAPQRIGHRLNARDSLFIFAVSGNTARMRAFVDGHGKKVFVIDSRTHDGNQALSFAAEAGDSAITAFLLKFPFNAKDKEMALRSALSGGSASVVRLLLENGAGAGIASSGEMGLERLFGILFDWRRNFSDEADTLIAKSLLSAYRKASPQPPGRYPLSLAKCMKGRRMHPRLMEFLLKEIPGPLDPAEFYKNLQDNWDILRDTATMKRVATAGYESRIRGAIIYSYYRSKRDGTYNSPPRAKEWLGQLNGFIVKGVDLGKDLDADWVGTLGKYQIRYDRELKRFFLAWRIPSLYSPEGDFNVPSQAMDQQYSWDGQE